MKRYTLTFRCVNGDAGQGTGSISVTTTHAISMIEAVRNGNALIQRRSDGGYWSIIMVKED